jgi:hypothetical protein
VKNSLSKTTEGRQNSTKKSRKRRVLKAGIKREIKSAFRDSGNEIRQLSPSEILKRIGVDRSYKKYVKKLINKYTARYATTTEQKARQETAQPPTEQSPPVASQYVAEQLSEVQNSLSEPAPSQNLAEETPSLDVHNSLAEAEPSQGVQSSRSNRKRKRAVHKPAVLPVCSACGVPYSSLRRHNQRCEKGRMETEFELQKLD